MDFNDATALMRLVQAVENDPYVSSGAGEALADKVREFIEDEAELGGWYTELMNAIGEGEPTFRECGTFTDHGFSFHAQDGTRTDYVIGWPFEDGGWAVLTGSYDLESDELADYHLPEDYLNGLLSRYGYSSLADFKSVNGEAWRDALTGIIAGNQEANRFEVPHLFPDPSAAERFCTYQGVPGDLLRPAMEKARAEYEKVKAHQSPEKAVSLKARWRRPVALPQRWPITETIQIVGRTPARKEDCDMKGMLIPTNGNPVEIDIEVDETGSTLHDLQRLVGGNIEPFDVIFGEGISLYVNEEGLFTCPPNRAVYATKGMEEAGYLSMMDYSSPVKEGELYSILCGDLVAVGFDFETGENRDLSVDEMSRVADYFTEVSKPGSGIEEVIAIRTGQRREEARSEDGRVTLKGEAQASRAASEKLAEGRGTGSPARDDHSIV